ncbi:hypothetical protein [Clostridium botulinum]|uniref:hypothetical protein n=1 Tax=Clostridium botulinum TaxID=1491 RepID=UPI00096CB62B|nr:hypothetical protein [Clostridium botulinum]
MENDKKLKEKIELNFHKDDVLELIILKMMDDSTFKRNREYFIKDVLLKYFKENSNKEFNEATKNVKGKLEAERKRNRIFEY